MIFLLNARVPTVPTEHVCGVEARQSYSSILSLAVLTIEIAVG